MKQDSFLCIGIDGSIGQWMVAAIQDNKLNLRIFDNLEEICGCYPEADRMIIDIPIGLPESRDEAILRPDGLLRKKLKRKGSSVFTTPCRQAVYEEDKLTAKELNKKFLGKSLSEQSLAIRKAIRQVDRFLLDNPLWKNRLLESHPEYCFMILNNGMPVMEKKTKTDGQEKRIGLLKTYCPEIETAINGIPKKRLDDAVDAICLAVLGRLTLIQSIKTLPDDPQADSNGILMQIVAV